MAITKITTAPQPIEEVQKINEIIDGFNSLPTVNNATLTIIQGETTKGTFTANASSDVTIALDAGGSSVGFPDFSAGVSVSLPFTPTEKGYLCMRAFSGGAHISVYFNGISTNDNAFGAAGGATINSTLIPVDESMTFTARDASGTNSIIFYPMKGIN